MNIQTGYAEGSYAVLFTASNQADLEELHKLANSMAKKHSNYGFVNDAKCMIVSFPLPLPGDSNQVQMFTKDDMDK